MVAFIVRWLDIRLMAFNGGKVTLFARFFIALILSSLGSLFFDHAIFKTEIEHEISKEKNQVFATLQKQEEVKFYAKLEQLKQEKAALKTIADSREDLANKEAEGIGSGIKGAGSAEKAKRMSAAKALTEWKLKEQQEQLIYQELHSPEAQKQLQKNIDHNQKFHEKEYQKIGLLQAVEALFNFLSNNTIGFCVWLAIFIIFLSAEMLPIAYKFSKRDLLKGL